jgi:hypothetical protein
VNSENKSKIESRFFFIILKLLSFFLKDFQF